MVFHPPAGWLIPAIPSWCGNCFIYRRQILRAGRGPGISQGEDAGEWSGPLQGFFPYQHAMLCGQTAGRSCCCTDPAIIPFNEAWDDISDRDHLHPYESASYPSHCNCRLEMQPPVRQAQGTPRALARRRFSLGALLELRATCLLNWHLYTFCTLLCPLSINQTNNLIPDFSFPREEVGA